jgi:hypothetical protein
MFSYLLNSEFIGHLEWGYRRKARVKRDKLKFARSLMHRLCDGFSTLFAPLEKSPD